MKLEFPETVRKKTFRGRFCRTPGKFLSAKGQRYEVSEGLEAGASGYIIKPFIPKELAARVKQLFETSGV